jgi:hypothetical protein
MKEKAMHNLYHGTSKFKARKIMKEGFSEDGKPNWAVPSRRGFVYLSTAYAPFFSMYAGKGLTGSLIKMDVPPENWYPDDDWLMLALGKAKYTINELLDVDPDQYRDYAMKSYEQLGCISVRVEDITPEMIVGAKDYNMKNILSVSDPIIAPANYMIMGSHYRALSDYIYEHGTIEGFQSPNSWQNQTAEDVKREIAEYKNS